MKLLCEIFKSSRKEGMYLYVEKKRGVQAVPEELLASFGAPESVMTLLLGGDRTLARADAAEVLETVCEQGYYLQLPPLPGTADRKPSGG